MSNQRSDQSRASSATWCPFSEAGALLHEALEDVVTVYEASSFADAIARAYAIAKPAGVVLLAPACSSFDMFADYAERGRKFKEEVARITRGGYDDQRGNR